MRTKAMMMVLLTILTGLGFSSCEKIRGKGEVISQTRNVTGYQGIELSVDGTIYLTPGEEYAMVLQGQENILNHLETKVHGNTLVIKPDNGVVFGKHDQIIAYITAPDISSVGISGSGNIQVNGDWQGNSFEIEVSGSGSVYINSIETDQFEAKISGSGNIQVNGGYIGTEEVKISGSGNVDLRNVESENNYTSISGSGDVYTWVNGLLDANISGSGNIFYLGSPSINAHISGSGNIRRL